MKKYTIKYYFNNSNHGLSIGQQEIFSQSYYDALEELKQRVPTLNSIINYTTE